MRPTLLLTAVATLGLASPAPSAQAMDATSPAARTGAPQLGQPVASDQVTARRRHHRSGAGSKVSMPNNAKSTGTQAPDAQQGGSGKSGAR